MLLFVVSALVLVVSAQQLHKPCHTRLSELEAERGPMLMLGAFTPQCDEDGRFSKMQCHGSTGYCWCVEQNTGAQIPGTSGRPWEMDINCEQDFNTYEFQSVLKRGLHNLAKRTGDCGPHADELAKPLQDLYKRLEAMWSLIQALSPPDATVDLATAFKELGIDPTDPNQFKVFACRISNIKNIADLAKLEEVPVKQMQMMYPMVTAMAHNVTGIFKDAVKIMEAMGSMGLYNLSSKR